jgi:ankyrin repeat protein/DNA-directed RNA polymerase specialized sigma24 family protein
MDDASLLQQFGQSRAREDFARLVERHAGLVYSACLRQLGERVEAERATQAVFVLLARRAARPAGVMPLVPWLFERSHEVCVTLARGGEERAVPATRGATEWSRLAARFDAGVALLGVGAREAFLLKYVAGCSLREVADALNVGDTQAGRRISEGVAGLRRFYESEGAAVSPEALVASVQAHAVEVAPRAAVERAIQAALDPAAPAADLADRVGRVGRRREVVGRASRVGTLLLFMVAAGVVGVAVANRFRGGKRQTAAATQSVAPVTSGDEIPAPSPPHKPVKPVDPALAARTIEAIRNSDTAALQSLLDEDENVVNARDAATGRSAVQIAADLVSWDRPDATRIAHFLIKAGAVTDIHTAARAGDAEYVGQLLRTNPALRDSKDAQSLTPLQRAALIQGSSPDCEQVVELLIRAGAKVDLWSACTFGRLGDVMAALDQHPEQVNQPCLGATPLNWAVRPRRYPEHPLAIPRLLLERGADPRSRDTANDGMSPLHHAGAWGSQSAVAGLLVERGVDVNVLDDFGRTPLDFAVDRRRKEMVAFFTSKGGRRTTVDYPRQPFKTPRFFTAVRAGDADLTHRLIDDTPELAKSRGPTGETPLHWAAANGSVAIIDLLLAEHVDVNAQETNKFGGTPLHWAVEQDRVEAVRRLLEKGADAKAVNARNGQTLLHVVAQHTDDAALAKLLLEKGIDPSARDRFGKTAYEYAAGVHPRVAELLTGE